MPKTNMQPPANAASPAAAKPEIAGEVGATAAVAPKNFRNHPDIENFFRFIYENDLREEGLAILDEAKERREAKRALKKGIEA